MAKTSSWVFGAIFVIAGIWGFFAQPALGFIAVSTFSNIIHLVVGIVLLIMAAKPSAVVTLKTVGILYVVFGILSFMGWIFSADSTTAWFYLVVGIIIAALGFSAKKGATVPPPVVPAAPAPQV
jgi:FtsH-binding integral membrane protein